MATASVWLVPADDERSALLAEAIATLATELGGLRFAPHLTLFALHDASVEEWDDLRSRLRERWAAVGPVEGRFAPLTTAPTKFRAVHLPVAPAPWVDELRTFGTDDLGVDEVLAQPHVSLAYVVPEPPLDRVGRLLGALPATVGFDRLAYVEHDRSAETFHPVPL